MKTIAIDVDGTIAALDKEWIRRYNVDYNDNMTVEQWTEWDIHKLVKPECGLKIYEYIEDPTIYDFVSPIENSLNAVINLSKICRIIYVTTSTLGASGAKYKWLEKHGFVKDMNDYIECKDKSLVRANYLVDDRYENVKNFIGTGILFTQPWNKSSHWYGFALNSWFDYKYLYDWILI